jgi:hypothetical protein
MGRSHVSQHDQHKTDDGRAGHTATHVTPDAILHL